ncbi:Uncharacterized protein PBTT_02524 [Plasmodiophora brassicae]|uniref:Uncharacterized protein n=1 Tax=Plasmodiophora brassicae TaxID=37360 RepID=A0A0G4ISX3_PLABS|nr:hypothetical protein PBRA_006353 [Plasmodiophora brassicae]
MPGPAKDAARSERKARKKAKGKVANVAKIELSDEANVISGTAKEPAVSNGGMAPVKKNTRTKTPQTDDPSETAVKRPPAQEPANVEGTVQPNSTGAREPTPSKKKKTRKSKAQDIGASEDAEHKPQVEEPATEGAAQANTSSSPSGVDGATPAKKKRKRKAKSQRGGAAEAGERTPHVEEAVNGEGTGESIDQGVLRDAVESTLVKNKMPATKHQPNGATEVVQQKADGELVTEPKEDNVQRDGRDSTLTTTKKKKKNGKKPPELNGTLEAVKVDQTENSDMMKLTGENDDRAASDFTTAKQTTMTMTTKKSKKQKQRPAHSEASEAAEHLCHAGDMPVDEGVSKSLTEGAEDAVGGPAAATKKRKQKRKRNGAPDVVEGTQPAERTANVVTVTKSVENAVSDANVSAGMQEIKSKQKKHRTEVVQDKEDRPVADGPVNAEGAQKPKKKRNRRDARECSPDPEKRMKDSAPDDEPCPAEESVLTTVEDVMALGPSKPVSMMLKVFGMAGEVKRGKSLVWEIALTDASSPTHAELREKHGENPPDDAFPEAVELRIWAAELLPPGMREQIASGKFVLVRNAFLKVSEEETLVANLSNTKPGQALLVSDNPISPSEYGNAVPCNVGLGKKRVRQRQSHS